MDLIFKRQKFGKKDTKKQGDAKGDNEDDESSREETRGDNQGNQGKQDSATGGHDQKDNKSLFNSKRPVIFICNDSYSKGLKPLKFYCHHFKLEKNSQALIERLKHINRLEVGGILNRILVWTMIRLGVLQKAIMMILLDVLDFLS